MQEHQALAWSARPVPAPSDAGLDRARFRVAAGVRDEEDVVRLSHRPIRPSRVRRVGLANHMAVRDLLIAEPLRDAGIGRVLRRHPRDSLPAQSFIDLAGTHAQRGTVDGESSGKLAREVGDAHARVDRNNRDGRDGAFDALALLDLRPQAAHDMAGYSVARLRIPAGEPVECGRRELDEPGVPDGADGGGARAAVDQRHFTDRLAPPDLTDDLLEPVALHHHVKATVDDDECSVGRISLSEQRFSAAKLHPRRFSLERLQDLRLDLADQLADVEGELRGLQPPPYQVEERRQCFGPCARQSLQRRVGHTDQFRLLRRADRGAALPARHKGDLPCHAARSDLRDGLIGMLALRRKNQQPSAEHDEQAVRPFALVDENRAGVQMDFLDRSGEVLEALLVERREEIRGAETHQCVRRRSRVHGVSSSRGPQRDRAGICHAI